MLVGSYPQISLFIRNPMLFQQRREFLRETPLAMVFFLIPDVGRHDWLG